MSALSPRRPRRSGRRPPRPGAWRCVDASCKPTSRRWGEAWLRVVVRTNHRQSRGARARRQCQNANERKKRGLMPPAADSRRSHQLPSAAKPAQPGGRGSWHRPLLVEPLPLGLLRTRPVFAGRATAAKAMGIQPSASKRCDPCSRPWLVASLNSISFGGWALAAGAEYKAQSSAPSQAWRRGLTTRSSPTYGRQVLRSVQFLPACSSPFDCRGLRPHSV